MEQERSSAVPVIVRLARLLTRAAARRPRLRAAVLNPAVVRAGYGCATGCGLAWGLIASRGRLRRSHGLVVAYRCPRWAFGRGGTTIGGVYLTHDNVAPGVLQHEAVHRDQWMRYGLAFIPLYVAAGIDPRKNRFEIEAGLRKGGYS